HDRPPLGTRREGRRKASPSTHVILGCYLEPRELGRRALEDVLRERPPKPEPDPLHGHSIRLTSWPNRSQRRSHLRGGASSSSSAWPRASRPSRRQGLRSASRRQRASRLPESLRRGRQRVWPAPRPAWPPCQGPPWPQQRPVRATLRCPRA